MQGFKVLFKSDWYWNKQVIMKQSQNLLTIATSILLLSCLISCKNAAKSIDPIMVDSESNKAISNFQKVNHYYETATDSVKLRNLLIEIYKWHESKGMDYYLIYDGRAILGVDSIKLDSTLNELRKTDFFSIEFLDNFKNIGQKIDYRVKQNPNDFKDGFIYFPFQDYDTWYGGNGLTPNWDDLRIYDLTTNQDSASFKWTCKKTEPKNFINVKFKRVNGKWKLDYLQYMDLNMY